MAMEFRMECRQELSVVETSASLARRARVALYRTRRGEHVKIHAADPMLEIYLRLAAPGGDGIRVPPGMAHGFVPQSI